MSADSYIDAGTKKVRTQQDTISGNVVETEVVSVTDGAGSIVDPRQVTITDAGAVALESGGNLDVIKTNTDNLSAIKTDVDKIPSAGQAVMDSSLPVVIASNQSQIPVTLVDPMYAIISANVAQNAYLDLVQTDTQEIEIHNIYQASDIQIEYYDGENSVIFDTDSGSGVYAKMRFHCNATYRIRVKNTNASAQNIGADGIILHT